MEKSQEVTKSIRMSLSKHKNHILFFETTFDEEGLKLNQRRAALEIVTTKKFPTPELVLENALKYEWAIDEEVAPNDGWYEIVRVGEATVVTNSELKSLNPDEIQHS